MRKIAIATVSFEITETLGTPVEHLVRCRSYVAEAASKGARIVCLPETVTTYHTAEPMAAEEYPGEWTSYFQSIAQEFKIAIVAPYYVRSEGIQYDQATIISAEGAIAGFYRKLQPTGREAKIVTPGDKLEVIDLGFAKVGVMICMDIYFPEIARIYAMKGAEILFWPTITHGPSQQGLEMQARVRAMDNSLVIVESNLSQEPPYAPYLGRFYPGTARIIDHNGDILAHTGRRPGVAIADVELDEERKTLDCFLIEEIDHTRRDIESLARMDIFATEYAALAKKQKRFYDTITRRK